MNNYADERYPKSTDFIIDTCYLCNELLGEDLKMDHIIPDNLFRKGDPNRPQLPVHHFCNNKKSKDDKWFGLYIKFLCSHNPEAEKDLIEFLQIANKEKQNKYLIGRKVPNYRLALTIFGEFTNYLELPNEATIKRKLPNKPSDIRLKKYMEQLLRGLFIRNMPQVHVDQPKIKWFVFNISKIKGTYDKQINDITSLVNISSNIRFSQRWPGRISYYGAKIKNEGFIYIEFFGIVGAIGLFQ